jgi:hypothetical protein
MAGWRASLRWASVRFRKHPSQYFISPGSVEPAPTGHAHHAAHAILPATAACKTAVMGDYSRSRSRSPWSLTPRPCTSYAAEVRTRPRHRIHHHPSQQQVPGRWCPCRPAGQGQIRNSNSWTRSFLGLVRVRSRLMAVTCPPNWSAIRILAQWAMRGRPSWVMAGYLFTSLEGPGLAPCHRASKVV